MSESQSIKSDVKVNYYQLLGVEKNATELEIKSAYRKLALKYHPDRNAGSDEAADMFKQLSTAYAILGDPNKRRQYDVSGDTGKDMEFESVDVESMGSIGRVVGALFTRIGLPIPTQISQSVLSVARDLCDERNNAEFKPEVHDLPLGVEISARVDKQGANFYRINVEVERESLVIMCRSATKSKFKVVLFDEYGGVRVVQESIKKPRCTAADMYLTSSIELMELTEPWAPALSANRENADLPEIFSKLSLFEVKRTVPLEKRHHLICVYGDNWLSQVRYSIKCMKIQTNNNTSLTSIQESETQLTHIKRELDDLQREYVAAKKKFEEVAERVSAKEKQTNDLLTKRDQAYESFLQGCEGDGQQAISTDSKTRLPAGSMDAGEGGAGRLGGIFGRFSRT